MKARSTLLFLALTLALVACGSSQAPVDTLELADHAADPIPDVPDSVSSPETADDQRFFPAHEVLAEAPPADTGDALERDSVPTEPALTASFTLRHGETLHHFARWSGLPVETVADSSGLDLSGTYRAGDTVVIPLDDLEQRSTIESARDAHHTRRAEGYLASRGGAIGVEFVTVATGDSATSIAREQMGLPLWLLQTYNPSVDLDRIRPGQELMVPVVADIVVDAEDIGD